MVELKKIIESFEKACSKGDLTVAEELMVKLQEIGPEVEANNEIYADAVVKTIETFQGKISSLKLKKLLGNVEEIIGEFPDNNDLVFNFAKALRYSLTAMSTKGQPNAMKEIMDDLEKLAEKHPENMSIHEELSAASHEMVHFWKRRGDFKALRDRTTKFRELVKKFPDNEQIKLNLTKSLVHEIDSSNKRDISKIDTILLEIKEISESMPANVGLQLEWMHAYRTAMDRTYEKPEDANRWLDSMRKIVVDKKDSTFNLELAKGYMNTISLQGQQNIKEMDKYLDELEMLADNSKDSLEMQTIYAQSILISLKNIGISDYKHTEEMINELKGLAEDYPKNKVILEIYVESLVGIIGLLAQEQKADEILKLVKLLEVLDEKYPNDSFIQQTFDQISAVLKQIGFKRSKKKTRRIDYM